MQVTLARCEAVERADLVPVSEMAGDELAEHLACFAIRTAFPVDAEFESHGTFGVAVDIEFDPLVRAEGKIGNVAQQAIVDRRRRDLFEDADAVVGAQIVDHGPPRREVVFVHDVREYRLTVGRIVDAADVFLGQTRFAVLGFEHDHVGGVLQDEPAQLGPVVQADLIRTFPAARHGPNGDRREKGEEQDEACCQHIGRIIICCL